MIRYFSYALSGDGVLSAGPFFLIILLKKAGIVFPFHPKFNKAKGQFLFFPIQEIDEEMKRRALVLLQGEGFAGAEIKTLGNYVKW